MNIGNINVSGGTLDFQSGASGSPVINLSGSLTQTAPGMILSSGTSTANPTLNFNGIANQAITFATQPTGPITYRISNPLGITLNANFANFALGNGNAGGLRISTTYATPITLAGNLTALTFNAVKSTLTFDAAGITTASALIFPSASGPASLTINTGAGNGVNIPFDRTISTTLTMTSGDIYMGNYTLTLGTNAVTANIGTLSYTAGSIIGNFKKWLNAATGSFDFPVGVAMTARKANFNYTTAPTAGGTLTAKFVSTDPGTTGLPLTQGIINVNNAAKAGYWKIDAGDGLTGGVYTASLIAANFPGVNTYDSLVMLKRPSAGSWILDGTHVKTTGSNATPTLSRTLITGFATGTTTEFGVGGDILKNPMGGTNVFSITSGNWGDGTTWSTGAVPTANDFVTVSPLTTVTTAGGTPPYSCLTLSVSNTAILNVSSNTLAVTGASTTGVVNSAGGQININGGTLTIGPAGGGNRTFANNGSLNVSSGTLNINGNFLNTSSVGNIFTQSGGNINVDGNAAGVAANSVAAATYIVSFVSGTPTTLFLTGGTFTIVDPHCSSTSSYGTMMMSLSSAVSCGLGHTFAFGNGVSTDPGTSYGFSFYLWYSSGLFSMGNVVINGPLGINRFVNTYSTTPILGNLTINNGGELRASSSTYVGRDIMVNTGGILTNTSTLSLSSYTSVSSGPQTISGTGAFRNSIPTATIGAGGTGYVVGDVLTVLGGTYTSQAQFIVSAVTTGAVTSVAPYGYANYSVLPTFPASTSGGTGSGCTFSGFSNLSPTASLASLTINDTNSLGVTIGTPLSVSATLTLTAGKVNTTAVNLLTLGTPVTGTLAGGSATAFINGPFARVFPVRTATGTYSVTSTLYPVGKSGSYLPMWIDPTVVTNPLTMSGEAFTSNSGTGGPGVTNLSSKRWEAIVTSGAANLTSSFIQLGDAGIVNGNQIVQSTSAAGAYGTIVPSSLVTTGSPNTITTTGSQILGASFPAYFAYANVTPCTVPLQPTAFARAYQTSTGFVGSFTAPSPAPSNYLVVRYQVDSIISTPANFTTYTPGNSFGTHGGVIVSNSSSTSFTQTGLTAGKIYTYYIYGYNNSACYGPVYNTTLPLTANDTTCAAAVTVPGTPIISALTNEAFNVAWTTSGAGVSYVLEVATDNAFTSFVSGYPKTIGADVLTYSLTGLISSTYYYVRVRAYDNTSCYSVYSSTITVRTKCDPVISYPFLESVTPATISCWSVSSGSGSSVNWSYTTSDAAHGAAAPQSGTHFFNLNCYNAVTTYNPYMLYSPVFRLDAAPKQLKYYYWIGNDSYTPVPLALQISRDFGNTWLPADTLYNHTTANSTFATASTSPWTLNTIDLSAFANQGLYVQFRFISYSNYGYNFTNHGIDEFSIVNITTPTVTTARATTITGSTATSGGVVTNNGGKPVTARGVCWGTNADPDILGGYSYTTDGSGNGVFVSSISSLGGSTLYHYRAYATNLMGTSYGGDSTFTTLDVYPPQVNMVGVTNITDIAATANGKVETDGGSGPILKNGFVYSTTVANPLIGLSGVIVDTVVTPGLGDYSMGLTGLAKGTLYYINAWAENSVGKAYGITASFTTIGIATTAASAIGSYTATVGGNISSDGGNAITAHGVCFGTTVDPDISGSHTSDGAGSGVFASSLTLPTAATLYHIRAYATNVLGTFYGPDLTFTTLCDPGTILTTTPATRCGSGVDTLKATSSLGSNISWYADSLVGNPIGLGGSFVTPIISTTTKFYVESNTSPAVSATIGTGSSTTSAYGYPTLFGDYWYQDWQQMVYTKAELEAAGLVAGNITSLKFNVTANASATPIDYSISLGSTSNSVLTGFQTTGLTTVYGPTTPTMHTGINTITFTAPYNWDGISNILLDIRGTGSYGSANATTSYTATTGNTVVYAYSGSDNSGFFTSAPTATTSTSRLNVTFSNPGCVSARTPVVATVTTPPAITISANQTVCNNAIAKMIVTSTLSDYTSYVWSPAWNLYTDAAATIHYVAGAIADTVYAKTDTAGAVTYTCRASNVGAYSCANVATTKVTNLEKINISASASPATICPLGTSTLSATVSQAFNTSITSLYSFAASTSTYTPLVDPITTTATGDDGTQSITLPFAFNMAGTNYSSVLISTNGYVTLGASGSTWTNALASTTYHPVVAALWDDLWDDTYSSVKYKTLGVSPNRTFVIQWDSILWGVTTGDATSTYRQNFQIRLSETSNIINIVYGEMNTPGTSRAPSASIGINDYQGSVNHFNSVTPGSPATNSILLANDTVSTLAYITNGTTYSFTPSGMPSFTYHWDNSEIEISTSTSVAVQPEIATLYNFVATEVSTGCQNFYPPILVTVSNFPTITAQPSPSVLTKCAGQTATFTASANGQGLLYQWQKDGVNIPVASNASAGTATLVLDNVLVGSTGNYRLALLTDCSGTDTTFTNVAALTVNPRPHVTPITNTPVCSGLALNLTGTTDIGSTFKWTGPNSFNSTSQSPSITSVTMPAAGTYKFIATENGCSDTATTIVVIKESPTAITITPSSPTIDYGTIQSLEAIGGTFSYLNANVGKLTPEAAAGTGGGLTTYMTFDAISDFTLSTVDLFPYGTGAGTVTIELRTSTGTPIMSQTVDVIGTSSPLDPAQTVTLNFPITGGASYRLGVNSWTSGVTNLYRDLTGMVYPYTLPGVVSITGSSLGTGYYYFFYNWGVSVGNPETTTLAWTPTDSLFLNPAATIPYAGESVTAVYAKPSTNTTYYVTSTTSLGCTSQGSVLVNVSCPTPTLIPASNVIGNTTAKLYWSSSSHNFEIECVLASASFTGAATYTLTDDYTYPNPHSLLLTSLAAGTDYKYQIRGECGSGYYGSWSAEGTFTTLAPQGTWTGLTSTEWNVSTNWSGNILPLPTDNIVIPASAPHWPHVNVALAECNDLTIVA
ncbi:MAG: beta strand repeat-containing protein, partial [Ferruginibacter sp.]